MHNPSAGPRALVRRPLVVELVGAAGTGKTTILRALGQRGDIVDGARAGRLQYLPFFAEIALTLLPAYLLRYRHGRWFSWEETRSMVYLKAWRQVVRRRSSQDGAVTILDHGPIFRLALLRGFGPEFVASQVYARWWESALAQWSGALDVVIWLDAPDAVLIERINARDRWHLVKDRPESEACAFLARYRAEYEEIIARLSAAGGPRVLRFDTAREPLDQIVSHVRAAFELEQGQ